MTDAAQIARPLPIIECGPEQTLRVAGLSTSSLKALWDDCSGRYEHLWDDIHAEMNMRGYGDYVRV